MSYKHYVLLKITFCNNDTNTYREAEIMIIESTIHVHKSILEMLNKSAEITGRTRTSIIKLLMQRVMSDNHNLHLPISICNINELQWKKLKFFTWLGKPKQNFAIKSTITHFLITFTEHVDTTVFLLTQWSRYTTFTGHSKAQEAQ